MAAHRFELIDPSVNARKFWEVEVNGPEMTTRWGRIGAAPSQKTKDFGSAEKADAAASKLIIEKVKKGYLLVDVEPAGKKSKGKKSSKQKGKKSSGKKCAHCGMASKGPTDCPEPWEHSNIRCSCAWCKANAPLTTEETNWLAKHGWSSAQITEMNKSPAGRKEARTLIRRGKPKKPGRGTEAAVGSMRPHDEQLAREELLKHGVGFDVSRFREICQLVMSQPGVSETVVRLMKIGHFTDGKRDVLVIPTDACVANDVCEALSTALVSLRGKRSDGDLRRTIGALTEKICLWQERLS